MEALLSFLKKIIPPPVFRIFQPAYHMFLSALAAFYYGFPSRRLTVIGVTGTDGKTTVVHILHEIFAAAGHKVGSLSSLRFKINDLEEPNMLKMTMPGRFRLQRFLAECRGAGCRFVILEVTSQGILQYRHRFIRFQAAVLTNITPEHIESHGGFENYRRAKMEIFRRLASSGFAVLNQEDESSELFAKSSPAQIVWYSRRAVEIKRVGHMVRIIAVNPRGIQLEIDNIFLQASLGGGFNVMNIIAAAAAALAFNVSLSAIAQALDRIQGIPGRLEYVQRESFAVVVDYANTPSAYEQVYKSLSSEVDKEHGETYKLTNLQTSKLICVFGAPGGGRDKWKRPELGKIAGRYCKEIILTSDDPDEENPAEIIEEIAAGISNFQFPISKIIDRREAIRAALQDARPGDAVVITGMGAQSWMVVKGKKIPWDDRKIIREELIKLKNGSKL